MRYLHLLSLISLLAFYSCTSPSAPGSGTPVALPQAMHVGAKYLYEFGAESGSPEYVLDSVALITKSSGTGRTLVTLKHSYFDPSDSAYKALPDHIMGYELNGNYSEPLYGDYDVDGRWIVLPNRAAVPDLSFDTIEQSGGVTHQQHMTISFWNVGSALHAVGSSYLSCFKILGTSRITESSSMAATVVNDTSFYSPDLGVMVSSRKVVIETSADGTKKTSFGSMSMKKYWN